MASSSCEEGVLLSIEVGTEASEEGSEKPSEEETSGVPAELVVSEFVGAEDELDSEPSLEPDSLEAPGLPAQPASSRVERTNRGMRRFFFICICFLFFRRAFYRKKDEVCENAPTLQFYFL